MRFPQRLCRIYKWLNKSVLRTLAVTGVTVVVASVADAAFGEFAAMGVLVLWMLFILGAQIYSYDRIGTDEDPSYPYNRLRG